MIDGLWKYIDDIAKWISHYIIKCKDWKEVAESRPQATHVFLSALAIFYGSYEKSFQAAQRPGAAPAATGLHSRKWTSPASPHFQGIWEVKFAEQFVKDVKEIQSAFPTGVQIIIVTDHSDSRMDIKEGEISFRKSKKTKETARRSKNRSDITQHLDHCPVITRAMVASFSNVKVVESPEEADPEIKRLARQLVNSGVDPTKILTVGEDGDEFTMIRHDLIGTFVRKVRGKEKRKDGLFWVYDKTGIESDSRWPCPDEQSQLLAALGAGNDYTRIALEGGEYVWGLSQVAFATAVSQQYQWFTQGPPADIVNRFEALVQQGKLAICDRPDAVSKTRRSLEAIHPNVLKGLAHWTAPDRPDSARLISKKAVQAGNWVEPLQFDPVRKSQPQNYVKTVKYVANHSWTNLLPDSEKAEWAPVLEALRLDEEKETMQQGEGEEDAAQESDRSSDEQEKQGEEDEEEEARM